MKRVRIFGGGLVAAILIGVSSGSYGIPPILGVHGGEMTRTQRAAGPENQRFHQARSARDGERSIESEECPVHPEIDTMEFRPSDARRGEFRNPPY